MNQNAEMITNRIPFRCLQILLCAISSAALFYPASFAVEPKTQSPAAGPSLNQPIKDKWAVVIGIGKFRDPKINLRYPAKDARDFCDYLTTEGNFARDHVLLLTDEKATRETILTALGDKWLPRLANPDDLVLIYVSSHGSPADLDAGGVNYIIAYDTNVDCLYATGIPLQYLTGIIKNRVHSQRVVMILDTCHSGAANTGEKGLQRTNNVDAQAIMAGTGQMVIASSKPNQSSWEGKQYENSVFTYHLIKALKAGGAKTTLGEAFESMKDNVQEEVLRDRGTLQTPVMKSAWRGEDLAIAAAPTKIRTVTIDWKGAPSPETTVAAKPEQASPSDEIMTLPAIPPVTVLDNGNIYRVFNHPSRATEFNISYPALLTYIFTYHWNDGHGRKPGTISLRHEDGSTYGPWIATGKDGQGNVPNAYWECEPLANLKAGKYTILDSDPSSWAQNTGSRGAGFARVRVAPQVERKQPLTGQAILRSPETTIYKNGNVYAVYNGATRPTFNLKVTTLITKIMNYHWNNGRGAKPGTISLIHEDGSIYGPWRANGRGGQGGAPDAYWDCAIDILLKPGTYQIVDSEPSTWSQNRRSNGAGMTEITGVYQN